MSCLPLKNATSWKSELHPSAPRLIDPSKVPAHIAIIMDGNGRWAKNRHLPRLMGHRAGMKSVREVVQCGPALGVKFLTLYAFSAENWARPSTEVTALMRLLEEYVRRELTKLEKNNVRLRAIGRLEALPAGPRARLLEAIKATAQNAGLQLILALNYGGRQEIVDACNRAMKAGHARVDEKVLGEFLYAPDIPEPDLLIRTSGEMRLSNFLLWESAYTEIYVTPKLWPDFRSPDLVDAIAEFQRRERRFGGL
jgi:undecaprenyl diphosphate synthase